MIKKLLFCMVFMMAPCIYTEENQEIKEKPQQCLEHKPELIQQETKEIKEWMFQYAILNRYFGSFMTFLMVGTREQFLTSSYLENKERKERAEIGEKINRYISHKSEHGSKKELLDGSEELNKAAEKALEEVSFTVANKKWRDEAGSQ